MKLVSKYIIAGVILGIAGFGICSAENTTAPVKTDTLPARTVIRKTDNTAAKSVSSDANSIVSEADNLTAKDIIAKMTATYKECTSYLDSGVVNTTFYMKKGPYVDKAPFTTAFKRPGQFRFWFSSKAPRKDAKTENHIILVKNKEVFVWKDAKTGIEEEDSLSDAIADAVGASGGAAQTVPVLIGANQVGGKSIADLKSPKRIADALQDGVMCYRIQEKRTLTDAGPVTVWINKKTFLIHRIDSSQNFKDFRTETTKLYKPQVNIPIDESKFALNAPK